MSCSDDETVKIWAVKDKVRVDVDQNSISDSHKNDVIRIDVKNEGRNSSRIDQELNLNEEDVQIRNQRRRRRSRRAR